MLSRVGPWSRRTRPGDRGGRPFSGPKGSLPWDGSAPRPCVGRSVADCRASRHPLGLARSGREPPDGVKAEVVLAIVELRFGLAQATEKSDDRVHFLAGGRGG